MSDVPVQEEAISWQLDPAHPGVRSRRLLDRSRGRSRVFEFGLREIDPGAELPLHATAQAELVFVLGGRAGMRIGGTRVELGARASAYVRPGMPRAVEALGPEPLRYAYTYACERLGHDTRRRPVPPERAGETPPETWLRWEETREWAPVEPSKGLRVRFRRVMDPERRVEMIAGIGDIDPATHYTRHFHDQPEIYYILGGEGIVWVGEEEVPVRRGSTLYIDSRVVHGADSLGREPLSIFYVYGCEVAGHAVNWTAVEEIYAEPRAR
jgi:mannose-6-phosphate isomerase-like protein (cupin superfamily)